MSTIPKSEIDQEAKESDSVPAEIEKVKIPTSRTSALVKDKSHEFKWIIKPCDIYKLEYKDCRTFRDRFHQYWVEGKFRDCSQWKIDHTNCLKWDKNNTDTEALEKLVESELSRVQNRLRTHYANDIWEQRTNPPEDWTKELPPEIKEEYKNSFLQLKANQLKEGVISLDDDANREYVFSGTRCTIL